MCPTEAKNKVCGPKLKHNWANNQLLNWKNWALQHCTMRYNNTTFLIPASNCCDAVKYWHQEWGLRRNFKWRYLFSIIESGQMLAGRWGTGRERRKIKINQNILTLHFSLDSMVRFWKYFVPLSLCSWVWKGWRAAGQDQDWDGSVILCTWPAEQRRKWINCETAQQLRLESKYVRSRVRGSQR